MKQMNLPNRLTLLRMAFVPVILVFTILPYSVCHNIIALVAFCAASVTDFLDGRIARKYHLITDFGKFMDPLADKFMVIAAVFGVICRGYQQGNDGMFWVFMIMMIVTVFRELAVASIRLITVRKADIVVAANMLGKIKTVAQMICLILALLEPVVHDAIASRVPDFYAYGFYGLTYFAAAVAVFFTVWSGIHYLASYWKYLDAED